MGSADRALSCLPGYCLSYNYNDDKPAKSKMSQTHNDISEHTSQEEISCCPGCKTKNRRKKVIACHCCRLEWHRSCVGITKSQATSLSHWQCPTCSNSAESSNASRGHYGGDVADEIASLKHTSRVLPHIPKGARIAVADQLATAITEAVTDKTEVAWRGLMRFAYGALRISDQPKDGKKVSLTAQIRQNLAQNDDRDRLTSLSEPSKRNQCRKTNKATTMAHRVSSKLNDGDIRGALRALTSDDSFTSPTTEVVAQMKEKHPGPPLDLREISPPEESSSCISATREEVRRAIQSFPPASSSGLDGIRPSHLRALLSDKTAEAGQRLLTALTALINLALSGRLPSFATRSFYGACLIALRKKDGGLRPIAVGSVYRRIAAKVAATSASVMLGAELRPVQLGVATRNGCESAVHTVRAYAELSDCSAEERILVKLDVANAFNSVRRDSMLEVVQERAPNIYPFVWQGYSQAAPLFMGDSVILSQTGVQQGDPLSSLMFSLAIDTATRSADTDINVWYLDDGTLAGPYSHVVNSVQRVKTELEKLNLTINSSKCEVVFLGTETGRWREEATKLLRTALPDAREVSTDELELLGAPIREPQLKNHLTSGYELVEKLISRLKSLDEAHQAFFLLKNYVSAPRLLYLLRSAPAHNHPALLANIDELVRQGAASIANVQLDGEAWRQATLPVSLGGLGIRMTADLALPAHMASLAASAPMAKLIHRPAEVHLIKIAQDLCTEWQQLTGLTPPQVDRRHLQRDWDRAGARHIADKLLEDCTSNAGRARLRAAAQPHSGAWLSALPVASVGTLIQPDTLRIAVALRVGAPVCAPHRCRCGAQIDDSGLHALSCTRSAGRHPRHAAINNIIKRSLTTAGIPSVLEPPGLDRGDGRRPDGLTTFPFSEGRSLVWDATCVDTFAPSVVSSSALEAGAAAAAAETRKVRRYADISQRYQFVPVAVETAGTLGQAGIAFLRELGHRLIRETGDKRELGWLMQRISVAVIRGNSASITMAGSSAVTAAPVSTPTLASTSAGEIVPRDPGINAAPLHQAEQIRSEENPQQTLVLTGLSNTENTCYMNAIVQCLANTKPVRDYMLHDAYKADINTSSSGTHGLLIQAFASLLKDMCTRKKDGDVQVLSTTALKKEVERLAPRFIGHQQQDAQEFLSFLLQGLHDDVNRANTPAATITTGTSAGPDDNERSFEVWSRFVASENSKFVDIFVGQLRSTLICAACGHRSTTFEQFWDLSLSIPSMSGDITLQSCFDHFTMEEILKNDDRPRCPGCKLNQECTKALSIQRFPVILCVHLKRFSGPGHSGGKVTVNIPTHGLDLSRYAANQGPNNLYNMYAAVKHSGSRFSGHYTARCKHPETGSWHEYNDTRVSPTNTRSINGSDAYMLFFQQCMT